MIPRIESSWQSENWQQQWAGAIRDFQTLASLLELPPQALKFDSQAATDFPLRVPLSYVQRMRPGDPDDPLLRQVLPHRAETIPHSGFSTNPVGDLEAGRPGGLLQKYQGRALLMTTGACPVHCRYCFRRHFPYTRFNAAGGNWQAALRQVREDSSLQEIILSGGDPLSLHDDKLAELMQGLAAIPHITTLRIHSRLPVVLPDRITSNLLDTLALSQKQQVFVIHANHPAELTHDVPAALAAIHQRGHTLLNQTVLLRGINDQLDTQLALSRRLFALRVLPYYLHLLDPVAGAAHFDVTEQEGIELINNMRATLPGYLVPRLVREIAGAPSKTVIHG